MIVVVAGNHEEFEQWIRENFCYVGDKYELAKLDLNAVEKVEFIGNYSDHPFYWSDELLRFQMDLALKPQGYRIDNISHEGGVKPVKSRRGIRANRWRRRRK
jgi:hypothetical protein